MRLVTSLWVSWDYGQASGLWMGLLLLVLLHRGTAREATLSISPAMIMKGREHSRELRVSASLADFCFWVLPPGIPSPQEFGKPSCHKANPGFHR